MPAPRPLGNSCYHIVDVNVAWDALDIEAFLDMHYRCARAGDEAGMTIARAGVERNMAAVRSQEKLLANRHDRAEDVIADYTAARRRQEQAS